MPFPALGSKALGRLKKLAHVARCDTALAKQLWAHGIVPCAFTAARGAMPLPALDLKSP
jgi:hypothetical protein